MIEKREAQIIKNLYNFSKENFYHTALMLIGAGHRESIMELIEEVDIQESIKIELENLHVLSFEPQLTGFCRERRRHNTCALNGEIGRLPHF